MFSGKALRRAMTIAGLILLAAVVPTKIFAQHSVNVGANDIGGVVTSANGPEAGVWVIAETTRAADHVRAHRRHRRPGPLSRSRSADGELQSLGARLRPRRLSQGSTASPARRSTSRPRSAPNEAAAAHYYPGDLLVLDVEDSADERVRRQEQHSGKTDADRLAQADEEHRLHRLSPDSARKRPARFRRPSANSIRAKRRGCGAFSRASRASR